MRGLRLGSPQSHIQLQTFWIMRSDGTPLAQAARMIERDTYENRVGIKFDKGVLEDEKRSISEVLSRNIHMFGRGEGGGVRWLYFKKATLEQWVFAAIELEKRGFKIRRDDGTRQHTRELVSLYVGDGKRTA